MGKALVRAPTVAAADDANNEYGRCKVPRENCFRGSSSDVCQVCLRSNVDEQYQVRTFPAEEQNMVRMSLSESLAGIVSQLLLPTADGQGRIACNEILLKTPGLPNVIREGNTQMLYSIMQAGKADGMQAMDDVLFEHAKAGTITAQDAYMKATEKARFEPLLD